MSKENKYSNGKIYRIFSTSTEFVYIGSTTKTLQKRLTDHQKRYSRFNTGNFKSNLSSFEILKYPDCDIELLEHYPCESKNQLLSREQHHMNEQKNNINKNRALIANDQEKKEISKIYEKKRHLRDKVKRNELNRQYNIKNKEKIDTNAKQEFTCEICKKEIQKKEISRHNKTKFHKKFIKQEIL